MFDKQSIEAYRNIKAPEELREKVMRLNPELSSPGSNHRSKNAMLRPIAAVACAAVFCLEMCIRDRTSLRLFMISLRLC